MLKMMRDSFQHLKWILVAIVAIFILFIFVDWGAGGARSSSDDVGYAARVNGDTISYRDFNRALYFMEENYKRMYGGQFTPEMAEAMGLNRQVLNSLIDERLLLQQANRLHLTATQEEVRKRILTLPALNPEGHFVGAEVYTRFVTTELRYDSPAEFEDDLAKQITIEKMESAMENSIIVSNKAADAEYRRTTESAKIRYVLYPASQELAAVTVPPAEVETYYQQNQSRYAHGEQRDLKYLLADVTRIRSQLAPSETELRKRYDASKEDFKKPESAHIFHILIKVDPNAPAPDQMQSQIKAENLVKQLRAGADFAKLAKENSGDPSSSGAGGDMGWVDRGLTVEPFDTAAFTVPLNTISDPIRSKEYGYHIIKVTERRPAGHRTFEEVRQQLSQQMSDQMAKDQARDEIMRVSARLKEKKPKNAQEFAAFATDRVTSNDTQWFSKGEQIPGLGFNTPIVAWAFTAKEGDTSEVIGTQRGPLIAFVEGVRPSGVSPLADSRARVEQDAKMSKARELARTKLAAAMAGATAIDAVSAKAGLPANETNITHQGFINGIPGDTSALIEAVMSASAGQLKGPVVAGDGAVAFQVLEQKKVSDTDLAQHRADFTDTLRQQQARSLRASLLQRLRKEASVTVNEKLLEQKQSQQQGA
ncbi:MAG: SurA N-terminal domain-containing protein [Thermoanaerobaculia bacterium]